MVTKKIYNKDFTSSEDIKCSYTEKINKVIFDKLSGVLEFPYETIEGWDLMTEKEQEKLYSMIQKKINSFNK